MNVFPARSIFGGHGRSHYFGAALDIEFGKKKKKKKTRSIAQFQPIQKSHILGVHDRTLSIVIGEECHDFTKLISYNSSARDISIAY